MRWVLCAGVLLLACGKSELQGPGDPATGGVPATGGGTGGVAGIGGVAGTGGVAGAGGAAGAGAGGAAGALACQGEYTACECGCCGGTTPPNVCYYPEHGDLLAALESADRAVAADTLGCSTAGCSEGQHDVCCTTPAIPDSATYVTNGYSSDAQHIWIERAVGNRCTQFLMRGLLHSTVVFKEPYPIDLPLGLQFEGVTDGDCRLNVGLPSRPVIGVLGWVKTTGDQICGFAFDFTLFFQADDGSIDAQRFQSDSVLLPPSPDCAG